MIIGWPQGWIDARGVNLGFLYFNNYQTMSWHEAKNYCETLKYGHLHQAHLIEIYDSTQQNFLKGRLLEISQNSETWWIGLTDSENEGTWKWAHSGIIATYTSWTSGQPDDADYSQDFGCLQIRYNYDWDDCYGTAANPICQLFF